MVKQMEYWKDAPTRFALHIVVAILMFAVVGAATVALHHFIAWMSSQGVDPWINTVSTYIEYSLFVIDILLFSIYVIRTSFHHAKLFITMDLK